MNGFSKWILPKLETVRLLRRGKHFTDDLGCVSSSPRGTSLNVNVVPCGHIKSQTSKQNTSMYKNSLLIKNILQQTGWYFDHTENKICPFGVGTCLLIYFYQKKDCSYQEIIFISHNFKVCHNKVTRNKFNRQNVNDMSHNYHCIFDRPNSKSRQIFIILFWIQFLNRSK